MQMMILASYKSRPKGCYLGSKDFGGNGGKQLVVTGMQHRVAVTHKKSKSDCPSLIARAKLKVSCQFKIKQTITLAIFRCHVQILLCQLFLAARF